ncbi:hypothetical protein [Staphylothermus marinus]|uniref:hypothetical protein n=1 Tax=Staphylothermus marinus TaxID=2280 RepID=UPI00146A858F|nr:hypothetical protein [Staphylothermus marinus]
MCWPVFKSDYCINEAGCKGVVRASRTVIGKGLWTRYNFPDTRINTYKIIKTSI